MLPSGQQRALESLLGDGDGPTRDMVIHEVITRRRDLEPLVRDFLGSADARTVEAARRILAAWGCPVAEDHGTDPGRLPPLQTWKQLEELCWLMARMEYPGLDSRPYEKTLQAWADRVREAAGSRPSPLSKIRALRQILAEETGLHGNRAHYYDPSNSFINRVIDTRLGIPLTLSLVYLFVAHRAGWEAYGLNTPGHYLAGLEGLVFDPYHGAAVVSPESLAERFGGTAAEYATPDSFRANPADTAQRMLANLLNCYLKNGDDVRYRRIDAYLKILQENAV